jgi:TctA family transporter
MFGIPGESTAAAAVLDGYPMTRKTDYSFLVGARRNGGRDH